MKTYNGQRIQDFSELSIGDFVVHEKHGLGIYKGIEKVEVDRIVKDYIKIEYRGGATFISLPLSWMLFRNIPGRGREDTQTEQAGRSGVEKNKIKSKGRCPEHSKRAGGALCGASGKGRLCVRPRHCMAEGV